MSFLVQYLSYSRFLKGVSKEQESLNLDIETDIFNISLTGFPLLVCALKELI